MVILMFLVWEEEGMVCFVLSMMCKVVEVVNGEWNVLW